MTVSTAQIESEKQVIGQIAPISKEDFFREYSDREDGYKYEWNNGIVEKTESMKKDQLYLQDVLLRALIKTHFFSEGGTLTSEGDMDTSPKQLRRPDMAIYTREQLYGLKKGEHHVPCWVAEVISENDQINKLDDKIVEYFKAGVQIVWVIKPHSKQVQVYSDIDKSIICMGKTICSGAPAIEGFEIAAEDLF